MPPGDPPKAQPRCPVCGSARAESLAPAVRDWLCCCACGHIWPLDQLGVPPQEPKIAF